MAPKDKIEVHIAPPAPIEAPKVEPGAEPKTPETVLEWAAAKGHIPPKGPYTFRADPHRGKPHVRVVMAHTGWPSNKVVSEAEYNLAVNEAYNVPIGENLADRKEKSQ